MTCGASAPSPGLCSVTFRQLSCENVITLAKGAKLAAIEWGTDVHLPPDNLQRAREIAAICADEGLATQTLGSYLRCNDEDENELNSVLAVASVLGAKRVRVWAGQQGSNDATERDRDRVANNLVRYCSVAKKMGISIALEHHPDTLTDTASSSVALLEQVDHPALLTYWQPTPDLSTTDAIAQLNQLGPWLSDIHVFHWVANKQRRPLEEGRDFWQSVFAHILNIRAQTDNMPFYAYLEFVRGNELEQCVEDAMVLNSLCSRSIATR